MLGRGCCHLAILVAAAPSRSGRHQPSRKGLGIAPSIARYPADALRLQASPSFPLPVDAEFDLEPIEFLQLARREFVAHGGIPWLTVY